MGSRSKIKVISITQPHQIVPRSISEKISKLHGVYSKIKKTVFGLSRRGQNKHFLPGLNRVETVMIILD